MRLVLVRINPLVLFVRIIERANPLPLFAVQKVVRKTVRSLSRFLSGLSVERVVLPLFAVQKVVRETARLRVRVFHPELVYSSIFVSCFTVLGAWVLPERRTERTG